MTRRYLYRTHVEGVWERPEDGAEWGMHTVFRGEAEREGFWTDFTMRRQAHEVDGRRTRHGTFQANGIMVVAPNASVAKTRAQAYLRAFVADLVCTSPKMTFDRAAARASQAGHNARLNRAA